MGITTFLSFSLGIDDDDADDDDVDNTSGIIFRDEVPPVVAGHTQTTLPCGRVSHDTTSH